jgi:hypothetical protein
MPFHLIDEGEDADALPGTIALRDRRQLDHARALEPVERLTYRYLGDIPGYLASD